MIEYNIEQALAENEMLAKDIRFSRTKMLVELFVSSFVLFFAFMPYILNFGYSTKIISAAVILGIVPTINICAWLIWLVPRYRSLLFGRYSYDFQEKTSQRFSRFDSIFNEIELKEYLIKRLKRTEIYVDILTALQFIMMGILSIYSIIYL